VYVEVVYLRVDRLCCEMDEWGAALEKKLKEFMVADRQTSDKIGPDSFKFGIKMYTVSFAIIVRKFNSVYLVQFVDGPESTPLINLGGSILETKTIVDQIRTYAQSLTKGWSDWHFWLSDAFADANIGLDQYSGYELKHDYFQVLLSKNGIRCYFITYYMPGTVTSYSLKSYPEKNDIPEYPETFDYDGLHVNAIVDSVLKAFQSISSAEGRPSKLISPQGNESIPHNSQPNQPAQNSDSSQLATMRLYEAIVELLIAVHANQQHLNDEEVLQLLQKARNVIRR
jgi:hypothetical protein